MLAVSRHIAYEQRYCLNVGCPISISSRAYLLSHKMHHHHTKNKQI